MPGYRAEPTRPDKAKAIAAVAAIYALVVGALLLVPRDSATGPPDDDPSVLIDIDQPAEPPAPPAAAPEPADKPEGAAGRKAEPSPVVAPEPAVPIPSPPTIAAAPIAGTGSAATGGAAASGSGPGAGGSGSGTGGGGGGGGGVAIEARLLGGNSARLPSHLLRSFSADQGFALLGLTIAATGRVTACSVLQSSGSEEVDRALCAIMVRQSRWSPARDGQGKPVTARLRYTATWRKN